MHCTPIAHGQCEAALCTASAGCLAIMNRIQCIHRVHTAGGPWGVYILLLGQVLCISVTNKVVQMVTWCLASTLASLGVKLLEGTAAVHLSVCLKTPAIDTR